MKKIVFIVLAAMISLSFLMTSCTNQGSKNATTEQNAAKAKVTYTCPMCKEVTSDNPGKCPKCGMDLVKKDVKTGYLCPGKCCPCPASCGCMDGKACTCGTDCKCPMSGKGEVNGCCKTSSVTYTCPSNCGCSSGSLCTCPKCGRNGKV